MLSVPIFNREAAGFELPPDGWFHLVPRGTFPVKDGRGEPVDQILDSRAMEALLSSFNDAAEKPNFPGILIDFDHFSYDTDKSSEAAGWVTKLEVRDSGLWGQVKWTMGGEAALKGGKYRFISPVWDNADTEKTGRNQIRPLRLESLGLTNQPNMRGANPLTNRRRDEVIVPRRANDRFDVILNRACEESGDVFSALPEARMKNRKQYDAMTGVEKLRLVINRVQMESGLALGEAYQVAEKLAPEIFEAADPNYRRPRWKRVDEMRSIARLNYKAHVLKNRRKIEFGAAFEIVSREPGVLANRKADSEFYAERYEKSWWTMAQTYEGRILSNLEEDYETATDPRRAHYDENLHRGGWDEARSELKQLFHQRLKSLMDQWGSVRTALKALKKDDPTLYWDYFVATLVEEHSR